MEAREVIQYVGSCRPEKGKELNHLKLIGSLSLKLTPSGNYKAALLPSNNREFVIKHFQTHFKRGVLITLTDYRCTKYKVHTGYLCIYEERRPLSKA